MTPKRVVRMIRVAHRATATSGCTKTTATTCGSCPTGSDHKRWRQSSTTATYKTRVPREYGAYDEMYDTNTELNLRSPGLCGIPYVNNKQEAETLMSRVDEGTHLARQRAYNREVHIDIATVGTVLFYRLDVWHRGTPVHVGKVRCIHNIVWKRPDAFAYGMSTNWNSGFCNKLYNGWLETFVASLQYEQLLAIGFPPRESPYWTPRTVATVQKRYGGMDLRCFLPRTTSRL